MSPLAAAIAAQLDAALVVTEVVGHQLSYLPDAKHFAEVDEAVRCWAIANGLRIAEWGHWSTSEIWIEGIRVAGRGYSDVVTLHTPHELLRRKPVAGATAPVDPEWSAAQHTGVSP